MWKIKKSVTVQIKKFNNLWQALRVLRPAELPAINIEATFSALLHIPLKVAKAVQNIIPQHNFYT
jgi:hypothetical protein